MGKYASKETTPGVMIWPGSTGIVTYAGGATWGPPLESIAVIAYPPSGIPCSSGSSWGTSYTTTGSGTVIALAAAPTFTGNVTMPGMGIWNSSGNVGIGTTSPAMKLTVDTGSNIQRFETGVSGPYFELYKYRGTESSKAIIVSGDELGKISYWGYDGTNLQKAAAIQAYADGTVTSGVVPGRIEFQTSATNTAGLTTRLTILSGGNVGIGTTSPCTKLHVYGGALRVENGTNIGAIQLGQADGVIAHLKNLGYWDEWDGADYFRGIQVTGSTHNVILAGSEGNVGIGTTSPAAKLAINGGLHVGGDSDPGTDNLWIDGIAQEPNFISGWQGSNWQIQADGDAEFNNVRIRGGLSVYELIINQLHYQNGGLIIGAGAGKVATIETATVGSEVVTFHDPEGNDMVPFTAGAIVMVQRVDISKTVANGYTGDVVKKIVRQVASVSGMEVTLTSTAGWTPGDPAGDDTGIIEVGDEICAIGHISNTSLDSALYLSATDSDNPFLRVMDGVSSYAKWSLGDKTTCKLQLGNLASLASYDIMPASPGYGLYCDNVYLNGRIVLPQAGMTNEGSADSDIRIYAGEVYANRDTAPFRVTQDGSLTATGVAEIGTATAVMNGKTSNLAIIGPHLWENAYDGDESGLHINYYSYNATHDHYRGFVVYGGKEVIGRYGDPVVHKLLSIQGGDINSIELGNSVQYPDLLIGLCGNIENSWANQYVYAYSGVSDTVILSHDAEVTETGTSYAKKKTITLGSYIKPNRTLRIKFDLKANANISYAQIYRNGSAVGTERSTASVIYLTFSEDITGWDPSDRIELYVKSTAGNTASACNLRVCGTMVTTIQNEVTGTNS